MKTRALLCSVAIAFFAANAAWADTAPLFEDTFTTLNPALTSTVASVSNGKLVMTLPVNSWCHLEYSNGPFADADISATFSLASGDTSLTNEAGLIFWAVDYSNFYEATIASDGSCNFHRQQGGRWLYPAYVPASATVNKGPGATNVLRVVTKGNKATLYINGTQMVTITGMPPSGGGRVGFSAQSSSGSAATWTVQDLKVLPAPQ